MCHPRAARRSGAPQTLSYLETGPGRPGSEETRHKGQQSTCEGGAVVPGEGLQRRVNAHMPRLPAH